MPAGIDKDALLQEFAAAVAEERSAWQRWKDPELNEDERDGAYSRWMCAAERTKVLALQLTALKCEEPPPG